MFGIEFLSNENLALLGVIVLFVWRIIDAIIRVNKRRRHELEKLAFEMAKIKASSDFQPQAGATIIGFYYYCLFALEKKFRTPHDLLKWIKRKEEELDKEIIQIRRDKERFEEVEERIFRKEDISWEDLYKKVFPGLDLMPIL